MRHSYTVRCHAGVQFSFRNALVNDDGPILTAKLGHDRRADSSFEYSSKRFSLSALVRKNPNHLVCQDTAIVFISDNDIAIGVFDGYGENGTVISEKTADLALALLKPRSQLMVNTFAQKVLERGLPKKGGTTATLAVVHPEGGLYMGAAGDSPGYRIKRGGIERVFEYGLTSKGIPITTMKPEEYFAVRNRVYNPISVTHFDSDAVMNHGGFMKPGESIVLASDALPNSLRLECNPETGLITDCSGCSDLKRIIGRKRIPSSIVDAIEQGLAARLMPDANISEIPGTVIKPKNDDLTLIVLQMHRLEEIRH